MQGGTLVRRTAYQSCREILTSNRDRRRRSGYRAKVVSSYPDAALLAAAEASHDGSKRIRIPNPNLIGRIGSMVGIGADRSNQASKSEQSIGFDEVPASWSMCGGQDMWLFSVFKS